MIRTQYLKDGTLTEGDESQIATWQQQGGHLWIDICDEPAKRERKLLTELGTHEMAIADLQRVRHPPKVEHFENFCLLLYRGLSDFDEHLNIETIQMALLVNEHLLITRRDKLSKGIEEQWHNPKLASIIESPASLMCHILASSAKFYISAVLDAEKSVSELEDAMLSHPDDQLMQQVIMLKSQFRKLMRTFRYHTRLCQQLLEGISDFVPVEEDAIRHRVQDVFEKFDRLESLCHLYYDLCGDLIEGYISLSSHQLNKTMQVLTVITAIFVPLTFIAGIYGMNFENMPELRAANGYFIALAVMVSMALALLFLFRRKRWL